MSVVAVFQLMKVTSVYIIAWKNQYWKSSRLQYAMLGPLGHMKSKAVVHFGQYLDAHFFFFRFSSGLYMTPSFIQEHNVSDGEITKNELAWMIVVDMFMCYKTSRNIQCVLNKSQILPHYSSPNICDEIWYHHCLSVYNALVILLESTFYSTHYPYVIYNPNNCQFHRYKVLVTVNG